MSLTEHAPTFTPRAWIGCLASYNAGRLIGEWVDATDIDEMNDAKDRIAATAVRAAGKDFPVYFSDPEEFALFDYDGFPSSLVNQWGEFPDWNDVAAIGQALTDGGQLFATWLQFASNYGATIAGMDAAELLDKCHAQHQGDAESEREYTADLYEDVHAIPSWLQGHIDWDSLATEQFQHGTLELIDGHVFDSEA